MSAYDRDMDALYEQACDETAAREDAADAVPDSVRDLAQLEVLAEMTDDLAFEGFSAWCERMDRTGGWERV